MKKNLSHKKLGHAAALSGAAALLVVAALAVSPGELPTPLSGALSAFSSTQPESQIAAATVLVNLQVPSGVTAGQTATLTWTTYLADRCFLAGEGVQANFNLNGTPVYYAAAANFYTGSHTTAPVPQGTHRYTLYCDNSGYWNVGSGWAIRNMTVGPEAPQSCQSTPNVCGQTSTGTVVGGVCNATQPSDASCPICTSGPNNCGQTNQGYLRADNTCTATPPPNSSCPATPVVTINSFNGSTPTTNTEVGDPLTIRATFTAQGADTLTGAAINGPNSSASVPGGDTNPAATKSYVFTPTVPGTYVFTAAVRSTHYPSWSGYGQEVSVTVVATPACSDPNAVNPPACTCSVGFEIVPPSTICTPIVVPPPPPVDPTLSLTAADNRVRQGTPAQLTWAVSNLLPTDSCSIASNPASVFSRSQAAGPTSWGGATVATGNLTGQTTFTLSCSRGVPVTITVNILPTII